MSAKVVYIANVIELTGRTKKREAEPVGIHVANLVEVIDPNGQKTYAQQGVHRALLEVRISGNFKADAYQLPCDPANTTETTKQVGIYRGVGETVKITPTRNAANKRVIIGRTSPLFPIVGG